MEINEVVRDAWSYISTFLSKMWSTFKSLVAAYSESIKNSDKSGDSNYVSNVKKVINNFFKAINHDEFSHMMESIMFLIENCEDYRGTLICTILSKFKELYGSNERELQKNLKELTTMISKYRSNFVDKDVLLFFDRIRALLLCFERSLFRKPFSKNDSNYKLAISEMTAIMDKAHKPKQIYDILVSTKTKKQKKLEKEKEQNGKRATMPFILYTQERRPILVEENPGLSIWEISKIIGREWKEKLTEKERAAYNEKYYAEKENLKNGINQSKPKPNSSIETISIDD